MRITFGTFAQLEHVHREFPPKYDDKNTFSGTKFNIFKKNIDCYAKALCTTRTQLQVKYREIKAVI